MISKTFVAAWILVCGCGAASAAEPAPAPVPVSPAAPLPTFALNAPSSDLVAGASPWAGLYAGTEVFAVGGKGIKGGFGGGGFAGYNRAFANNWVLGVEGGIGYSPNVLRLSRFSGFDYASTSVKAGYDMGRFMPFVTAGVAFANPHTRSFGYTGATDAANALFNDEGNLKTFGTVGAGVDYAITNNLSMELAVSASRGPGVLWP